MSGWTIPNRARLQRVAERREAALRSLNAGRCLKQAAWDAGVSYRTARRYCAEAR